MVEIGGQVWMAEGKLVSLHTRAENYSRKNLRAELAGELEQLVKAV